MFGQGNQAPPRPGGSLQQVPLGVPQPLQQGGNGHGPGPGHPVYQTGPMPPHPHIQQVAQSGMQPNIGLYAQHNIGSNQGPYHYPPVQHHSQHPQQIGVQNLYHVQPPRSSLPLPPPPPPPPASNGFQSAELLPHPPSGYIMHGGVGQPTQPSGYQGFPRFQPPQQPLLASVANRIIHSESSLPSQLNGSQQMFTNPLPPPPPPLLHSSIPQQSGLPVPGSDDKELTSTFVISATESPSVLPCSGGYPVTVKMNGVDANSEHSLTSRDNDSSKKVDCVYHEGEKCVSVVNSSLAMDNKSISLQPEAGSSSQHNSSTAGGLCSASDSDMDMEDDIVNLVEDLETNDSRKDQIHDNSAQAENIDAKERLHGPSPTPENFSGLPEDPSGVVCDYLPGRPSSVKSSPEVLQVYALDDSPKEPCAKNDNDVSHALQAIGETAILKKVWESNLLSNGRSNNHGTSNEESNPATLENSLMQKQVTDLDKETEMDLKNSSTTCVAVSKPAEVANRDGSIKYLCDESQHPSQEKSRLKSNDMISKRGKSCVEDTAASVQLKVDEFGRLAKDISSDTDSDDHQYRRKRGRRGRSRSISPFDRRRKTPPRRRYNRSRSRSHSPLRRRSRSRSPGYRRPTESISERRRRDKIQTSICFNFRDGRCHRGSSCRFLHQDSDMSGSSNSYKRKRQSEAAQSDNGSNFQERSKGSLSEMGSHKDDKDKSHASQQLNSTKGIHPDSRRDNNVTDTNDTRHGITVVDHGQPDQNDLTVVSYLYKHEDIGGESAPLVEASIPQAALSSSLPSLVNSSAVFSSREPLGANHSAVVPQCGNLEPQKTNSSYESISMQHQGSRTSHLLTTFDPQQDNLTPASFSYAAMGSGVRPVVSENPSSWVPSSVSGTPFSQATTGHCMPQLQSKFSVMQTSTCVPPFVSGGGPSYNQFPLPYQPPQSSTRPIPLWTSLPLPPPPSVHADTPNASNSTSGNTIPSHFEWNQQQPQRTDVALQSVSGSYSGHMHYNSQYGGNCHDNYHPSAKAPRPPFGFPEQRPDSSFILNSHTQHTEGLHLLRNDQTSNQGLIPSTFHVQSSTSFVRPPATVTLLPSETETACHVSSQSDKMLKNTSSNDPRNSVQSDSRIIGLSGKIESSSLRNSAAMGESVISEFEHSRTSVPHNMHASTSDHPPASVLSQPELVGAQGVEAHGSRDKFPSSISIRNAGQNFPGSGGGQYDPLLDSLDDKSSNSLVNSEQIKKQRSTSDSDDMPKGIVSHTPLDVEETNRKKESEAIASLTSSDNEEFGETADAEVGGLENESFSNPVDMPNRGSEIEISETYPDTKSKDSRSMKLFKCAIANFVKEVLKPSWRQGNMSKEAFKTIVKKTVEKVSGAMKGHRYPKSRAKINHYIDSSERKLTKLVMGYVDKYVKV